MSKIFNRSGEKRKRLALRNNMPHAEVVLWQHLKGKQVEGVKFRRQVSVGAYVLDFYAPELKLAIEVDGPSHFEAGGQVKDSQRQAFIEALGVRFLRFTNPEVYQNLAGVYQRIEETVLEMRSLKGRNRGVVNALDVPAPPLIPPQRGGNQKVTVPPSLNPNHCFNRT